MITNKAVIAVLCTTLVYCGPLGYSQQQARPVDTPFPHMPLKPPATGETVKSVRALIQQKVDTVQSLTCDLEMSEKREKKRSLKVRRGPLKIVRGQGARLKLVRKESTHEYIANPSLLWTYDKKDKEAQYIPTNLPIIKDFVGHAMRFNVFMSVDEQTLKLLGTQLFENEICWVLEGKSPGKLETMGVPVTKIRVWIAKKDGLPRRISIPDEDDMNIVLRNLTLNADIPVSEFSWSPPRGVKQKNVFGF